jgi:hypothetical protein
MSWRRRALYVIIATGAGICCLKPMVTYSIQRRLAAELNADTRIKSTILSLGKSTVVLEGVVIENADTSFCVDQLSLRLDPQELWYRNCVVDPMVGAGMQWQLPNAPLFSRGATEVSPPISVVDWSVDPRFEQAKQLLESASAKLSSFERDANSQTLELDQKIESIRNRIRELAQDETILNPLRPSDGIIRLENDLLRMKQVLAENQIQAQDVGKLVANTIQQSSTLLEAESSSRIDASQYPAIAERILEQTLDEASATLSPYFRAGRDLYLKIARPSRTGFNNSASRPFLTGSDLTLPGLEARKMQIARGRVLGVSIVNEQKVDTEIRIATLAKTPTLNIIWNGSDASNQTLFASVSSRDERELSSYRLERLVQGQSTLLSEKSVDEEHTLMEVEVPLRNILETPTAKQLGIAEDLSNLILNSQPIRLAAKMSIAVDGENSVGKWQSEPESKSILESMIAKAIAQKTKDTALQSSTRISQWIGTEKSQLDRRLNALEQSALDRKKSWDRQLKSLSENIREIESDSQRTARGASVVR